MRKHNKGINVRVDDALRQTFTAACVAHGSTASIELRAFMQRYINATLPITCTCHDPAEHSCPAHRG